MSRIRCLTHRADRQSIYQILFLLAVYFFQQVIDRVGNILLILEVQAVTKARDDPLHL